MDGDEVEHHPWEGPSATVLIVRPFAPGQTKSGDDFIDAPGPLVLRDGYDVMLKGTKSDKASRFRFLAGEKPIADLPASQLKNLVHLACRGVDPEEVGWPYKEYVNAGRRVRCRFFWDRQRAPDALAPTAKSSSPLWWFEKPVRWHEFATQLRKNEVFRRSVLSHLANASEALTGRKTFQSAGSVDSDETSTWARLEKAGGPTVSQIQFSGPSSAGLRIETNQYEGGGMDPFEFVLFMSPDAPVKAEDARNAFGGKDPEKGDAPKNELSFPQGSPAGSAVVSMNPERNRLMVLPDSGRTNKKLMNRCENGDKRTWNCYANIGKFVTNAPVDVVDSVFQALGEVLDKSRVRQSMKTKRAKQLAKASAAFGTHGAGPKWLHLQVETPSLFVDGAKRDWASPYKSSEGGDPPEQFSPEDHLHMRANR